MNPIETPTLQFSREEWETLVAWESSEIEELMSNPVEWFQPDLKLYMTHAIALPIKSLYYKRSNPAPSVDDYSITVD